VKNRNLNHADNWATPDEFLSKLHDEFGGLFDPCPLYHNIEDWDGLKIEWHNRNFINPPYSRKLKEAFVIKAIEESKKGKLCVMLLPVSTSTKLFHDYILPNKKEIRFIKSRLKFRGINTKGQKVNYHGGNKSNETISYEGKQIPAYVNNSGMHDSMIVIFNGGEDWNFLRNLKD